MALHLWSERRRHTKASQIGICWTCKYLNESRQETNSCSTMKIIGILKDSGAIMGICISKVIELGTLNFWSLHKFHSFFIAPSELSVTLIVSVLPLEKANRVNKRRLRILKGKWTVWMFRILEMIPLMMRYPWARSSFCICICIWWKAPVLKRNYKMKWKQNPRKLIHTWV